MRPSGDSIHHLCAIALHPLDDPRRWWATPTIIAAINCATWRESPSLRETTRFTRLTDPIVVHDPRWNRRVLSSGRTDRASVSMVGGIVVRPPFSRRRPALWSVVLVEDVAKLAREGFGLAGVSGLAAEEAAVVTGKHGRLLAEQLGGGH